MSHLRYLNTILTVLALLLAMNLWTAWTSSEPVSTPQAQAVGIPDAGAQRQQMIDLLKKLNEQQTEMSALLTSGNVRVRVERPETN